MGGSARPRTMGNVPSVHSLPHLRRAAHQRDLALDRPRRAARWVAGLSTAAAAAIAGIVAHQLPGASASASGSTSASSGSSASSTAGQSGTSGTTGTAGTGGSAASGTSGGAGTSSTPAPVPVVVPSSRQPTVVSGGSSIR
jgi:hypothetical protein